MRRLMATLVTVSAVGLGLAAPVPAATIPSPVFLPGLHLTAEFPYGLVQAEPSIEVDRGGRIYVMAPGSTPIGCELWTVSPDGRTFTFHTPPDLGVGGGDCDLAVSSAPEAGSPYPTVSYSSLSLPDLTVAKSTDGGATFTTPNVVGSQVVLDDREWNAAGEGSTVYMSYHVVASDNIAVSRSTDGGANYLFRGFAIDADHLVRATYNNELGPIVVNFASHANPKPIATIFTSPAVDSENVNTVAGSTQSMHHAVFFAQSLDGGATWTDYPIYVGPTTETYDHIFPSLGVDAAGGYWAAWSSDRHVFVTHAAPGTNGRSGWSAPQQIDATGAPVNIFPWIVGGGSGRAVLVWYGGTGTSPDDPGNAWTVHMAQLKVARTGFAVTHSVASDHVIHHGQICETGVTCGINGDRSLLDFFQVALTPDGRAAIAWADDSASPGVGQIYVTVQCAGVNARNGKTLPNTC